MASAMHTIEWKQHKDTLTQLFKDFRRQNVSTDVLISCEGFNIKAHRAVLAASSDFFDLILREHPPHVEPLIVVENVEFAFMQNIISFMYTGVLEIESIKTANFLNVCSYFQIKGLMTYQIFSKNDDETEADEIVPEAVETGPAEQEVLLDVRVAGAEEEDEAMCENEDVDLFVFLNAPASSSTRLDNKPPEENKKPESSTIKDVDEDYSPEPPKRGRTNSARKVSGTSRESSGYTLEQLSESIEAVCKNRMSLSRASQEFNVSKSVLWRKLQKCDEYKSRPMDMKREQAKKALLGGESMVAVSKKFKVPLATLYRDKNRMITDGKINQKIRIKSEFDSAINGAVEACQYGMSQSEAARRFNVPKSTLWRKLKSMAPA